MNKPSDLVESMIDSIVAGKTTAQDVVSSVLTRDGASDHIVFAEGEKPVCPDCGSSNMEEGFVESEHGKVDALQCKDCQCLLIAEGDESVDEPELVEAELDEENPCCPVCNSDKLTAEVVESENGDEDVVLTCGHCNTRMVVVG